MIVMSCDVPMTGKQDQHSYVIVAFLSTSQYPSTFGPINLAIYFLITTIYASVNIPCFCNFEPESFVTFSNLFSLSTKTLKNITSRGITFVQQGL